VSCAAIDGRIHIVGFASVKGGYKLGPTSVPPTDQWFHQRARRRGRSLYRSRRHTMVILRGGVALPGGILLRWAARLAESSTNVATWGGDVYVHPAGRGSSAPAWRTRYRFAAATVPHHDLCYGLWRPPPVRLCGCWGLGVRRARTAESFMDVSDQFHCFCTCPAVRSPGCRVTCRITSDRPMPALARGLDSWGSLHRGSGAEWVSVPNLPVERSDFHVRRPPFVPATS
jgi:hypothetical protein